MIWQYALVFLGSLAVGVVSLRRLLLVSPSLEFHPTSETILCYFAPNIAVERIGLAVEWRKGLRVMFRLTGAERPR